MGRAPFRLYILELQLTLTISSSLNSPVKHRLFYVVVGMEQEPSAYYSGGPHWLAEQQRL
jgi:hypothetical protein